MNMRLATTPLGPLLQSSYLMSSPLRNRIRSPALRAAFSAGLPARTGNERGFSWGPMLGGSPVPRNSPGRGIWGGWGCSLDMGNYFRLFTEPIFYLSKQEMHKAKLNCTKGTSH